MFLFKITHGHQHEKPWVIHDHRKRLGVPRRFVRSEIVFENAPVPTWVNILCNDLSPLREDIDVDGFWRFNTETIHESFWLGQPVS